MFECTVDPGSIPGDSTYYEYSADVAQLVERLLAMQEDCEFKSRHPLSRFLLWKHKRVAPLVITVDNVDSVCVCGSTPRRDSHSRWDYARSRKLQLCRIPVLDKNGVPCLCSSDGQSTRLIFVASLVRSQPEARLQETTQQTVNTLSAGQFGFNENFLKKVEKNAAHGLFC